MAHAVVLATNDVPKALRAPEVTSRALLPLNGRPVLARVLEGLRASAAIDEVIVIGPPRLQEQVGGLAGIRWLDGEDDVPTNLRRGLRGLGLSTPVLIVPADLALLTPPLADHLIDSHPRGVDIAYPLIAAEEFATEFPTLPVRPVRLRDGAFLGGRVILVKPQAVVMNPRLLQRAFQGPLTFTRLLRLLGWGGRLLHGMGLLTSRAIAARATRLLEAPCQPLYGNPPALALTLDSQEHLRVAAEYLLPAGSAGRRR
ncbi:MAG: NTP transferase domain-containing protein [Armatimonadetes bacterium]|jgi:hypothetical protein|nr:NTP transferase domain-containing protein [Armatimonadota bacterium]